MKFQYLLAGLLLLPPFQTYAIDNPFKSDPRPSGIVAVGVSLVVSGIYIFQKKPSKNIAKQFVEGVAAPLFISAGVLAILYANEIIADFDKLENRR